jgi:anaerobic magnesium-protoporphyrin IX monomethyl ester cyclase
MIGFACYRSNMEQALQTARLLREHLSTPIVAGGFGPTFHTEEFLRSGFDIVVRGEGEATVRELVRHFTTGEPLVRAILGISFVQHQKVVHNPSRPPIEDLDSLPFPAHDTLALTLDRKSLVHIQSSRGCQANCTFCSIVAFERLASTTTWRQRSLHSFVDELQALSHSGARYLKVIDDSLVEPPRDEEWCAALADEIQRRGLTLELRGSIRADRVSPAIVAHLKRAGFFSFSCGIENFAPTALKRMAKRASLQQNLAALDTFRQHDIYVQAGHILFDHHTTVDELEENWRRMTEYVWTISKGVFTEMYAAAGTNFTRSMERRGLLAKGPEETGTAGLGNAHLSYR